MRGWIRFVVLGVVGIGVGLGLAGNTLGGALSSGERIGPWVSGTDFGSADQSITTRAVIARRGLLALPAREARYYTAAVDDAGRALVGKCRYRVTGGRLPGQWWSLTLYGPDSYLHGDGPYSVASADVASGDADRWTIIVGPTRGDGLYLPTAGLDTFDLTLRTYLPPDGGRTTPARDQLPSIRREACA